MSQRAVPTAIISMAQQASPKVSGHSEFDRAQPISESSETTIAWPFSSVGTAKLDSRTSSAGRGRSKTSEVPSSGLPRVRSWRWSGGTVMAGATSVEGPRLLPAERPLLPGVGQADQEEGDEDHHLDQRGQAEGVEGDTPGEQVHDFDVED